MALESCRNRLPIITNQLADFFYSTHKMYRFNELSSTIDLSTSLLQSRLHEKVMLQEIKNGIPDQFRIENGYYQLARQIQQRQDEGFLNRAPFSFKAIASQLEPVDFRWSRAVAISRKIEGFLTEKGITDTLIDCRAKSVFSIFLKMEKYNLDPDEVYDNLGLRIVAKNTQQAYQIAHTLMTRFDLVGPENFKRSKSKHNPVRDTLMEPNKRLYAAIHLSLHDDKPESADSASRGDIFDIQITTAEAFIRMVEHDKEYPYGADYLNYKTVFFEDKMPNWHVLTRKVIVILDPEHWVQCLEPWETGLSHRIFRICHRLNHDEPETVEVVSPDFKSEKELLRFAQNYKEDHINHPE